MRTITVLISCRTRASGEAVRDLLRGQTELDVSLGVIDNGHADPLHGQRGLPDVLILVVDGIGEEMLAALAARTAADRPPTIVIAPAGDAPLMRRAMQIGARDYFSPPLQREELLESLKRIRRDAGLAEPVGPRGALIAVINAKGGSGASTIAANLAHLQAVRSGGEVALIDLDLQFGALPLAFDLPPHRSLIELLQSAPPVGAAALKEHGARHPSGVTVFSAMSDQMPVPWELPARSLRQFLDTARTAYPTVVVDLPRQIDPLTTTVLERADYVLIAMQQGLAHIRDAKRLLHVLDSSLAVPSTSVTVVINRFTEHNHLSRQDIVEAVSPPRSFVLPNDYKSVSEAQNIGVPLHELDKNAPITRALMELLEQLLYPETVHPPKKRGLRAIFGNP